MAQLPSYGNMDSISNDDYFSPATNSRIPLKQRIRDSHRKDRFIVREHSNFTPNQKVMHSPVGTDGQRSAASENSLDRVEVSVK